jgi:hypothetical protein
MHISLMKFQSRIYAALIIGVWSLTPFSAMNLDNDSGELSIIGEKSDSKFEVETHVSKQQLKSFIKEKCPISLKQASILIEEIYESQPRGIKSSGKNKYGQSFPMNPEFLLPLLQQAEGKTILELGAASGENSILFGCAGAKHVYVNDIEKLELERFQSHLKNFPEEIRKNLPFLRAIALTS